MDDAFLLLLDQARELAGIPFRINSGWRCKKHNGAEGGKKDSSHTVGLAVDIKCESSTDRFKIVQSLLKVGVHRIGLGKDFIHADDDPTKPTQVLWGYYP